MPDIGYASMPVIPTFKGLQRDLETGSSKALTAAGVSGGAKFGDSASKSAKSKFAASAKSIVAPLVGAFAAVKVGAFFKDAVTGASDLAESTNKVQQVFGKGTGQIFKFTTGAAKAIGQTNQQARDAAATFGIFGKAAKFTDKQNAKFSIRMTKLASDLASFHNTSPEQAIEAIGAAMRGEAEPIRAYGVLLDEATLKAEAMRLGILKPVKDRSKIQNASVALIKGQDKYNEALKKHGKNSLEARDAEAKLGYARDQLNKATEGSIPPLTQAQKVMAAQSSIMRQTAVAQGDFARTSGGLANQQRILSARWADAKAALGTALLPTVNKAVKYLNDEGIPAFERFADFFTHKGIPAIKDFGRKAEPIVRDVLGKAKDYLKEAQPYAEGFVNAFNSLPDGVKKGAGAAALLGFGATKIPGAKGAAGAGAGAAKGVLGLVTKSKPLPVYVVNGIGGGLPGKGGKLGTAGKTAGAVGIGAGGLFIGTVAALSVGAIAAAKFGKSVEDSTGVPKFGTPDNPMEQPILTPKKFRPDASPADRTAAANKPFLDAQQRTADRVAFAIRDGVKGVDKLDHGFQKVATRSAVLRDTVLGVEASTKRTRSAVVSLVEVLEKARRKAVLVDQGVSAARQSKVDGQLGHGMYVANMNVHGTSLPEVRRDADHKRRARAMGSESFQ